jgi:hypothetical protein
MKTFIIKNADGTEINRIIADESFVSEHYAYYEEVLPSAEAVAKLKKIEAREWRNNELERTDLFATVNDYPHAVELTAYRTALRDWPSTADFPDTRPESLEDRIANA